MNDNENNINKFSDRIIELREEVKKLEPEYKEREVQRITLKKYIEFIGTEPAAELFDCSTASTKAWRYGLRQPSIKQAKKIIKASGGKLDFESIFGPIEEVDTKA